MELLGHFDPSTGEPLGVWSLTGDGECAYRDPSVQADGHAVVQPHLGGGGWPDRARRLVEASSDGHRWALATVEADDLDGALEVLRRRWAGTRAPSGSSRFEAAARRVRFATADAMELAGAVLGEGHEPFAPPGRVSATTVLRASADGQRLAVLVAQGEADAQVDAALAFGLCFQADRDLLLVLPGRTRDGSDQPVAAATLHRAAFLVTPVRVFTYDDDLHVTELVVPAQVEARRATRQDEQIPHQEHQLGDRAGWVAGLTGEADADAELTAAHRLSYLAWHAAGRQVLRIKRSRKGLRLVAGVNYRAPTGDQPAPVRLEVTGPLTAEQHDSLRAAIQAAVADRAAGTDAANLEHQLQDVLATADGQAALGLAGRPLREVPATRPGQRRAYIDLLGVDPGGNLHLIETKLGLDEMLGLQGLDYWVWLQEHRDDVIDLTRTNGLEVAKDPTVQLDFVVGARDGTGPADLRYLAAQVEAFDGAVAWRIGTVTGWRDTPAHPTVDWLPRRRTPAQVPGRPQPRRFAWRLQDHLRDHTPDLHRQVFHPDAVEATVPAARHVTADLLARGLAHRFLAHVRSSQLFAVNLFGPLNAEQTVAVARQIDPEVIAADRPVFEYHDARDRLAEATHASPHTTQVDVLIRATRSDGRRRLLLIEVKLSEDDFGGCSAYQSPDNDRRDLCQTTAPFGGDPDGCFQLRNHGREHGRRYDRYLPGLPAAAAGAGCPFRASGNQPMRNTALARMLLDDHEADMATVVLCAHDHHQVIWRRWHEVARTLATDGVAFASLPASAVLGEHHPDTAGHLAARYQLPAPDDDHVDRLRLALWRAQLVLARVAGDGGVLAQLYEQLEGVDTEPAASLALARRLEIVTEATRGARAELFPPMWSTDG